MLLFVVIAVGFVVCLAAWQFWNGITLDEVVVLLVLSALIFFVHQKQMYNIATTDRYLVSGYITSLIYRPPYSYRCGKRTCHEPQHYLIEQRPQKGDGYVHIESRAIDNGKGVESCWGECKVGIIAPYPGGNMTASNGTAYSIEVDREKWKRAQVDEPSSLLLPYFNPVRVSDDVLYDEQASVPYFKFDDFNSAHRIIAPQVTTLQEAELERINARHAKQKVSIGLIITHDNLYFEKLKRAWHQGKANDFIVVVSSPDEQSIGNVNVLGWNNEELKTAVTQEVGGLASVDIDKMLSKMEDVLDHGPAFQVMDFSKYDYLDVKIPEKYYWRIIIFQIVFYVYMLALFRANPLTKEDRPTFEDLIDTWQDAFTKQSKEEWRSSCNDKWDFHPFAPIGALLHFGIPIPCAALIWVF